MKKQRLLVVTPARNEAHQIKGAIESVLSQTLRPWRYYLVSDGSDDGTDEIMRSYANKYDFIYYLRREKPTEEMLRVERVTPGQIGSLNYALDDVGSQAWDYLAVLDADIELPSNWYEKLVHEFNDNPNLGLAGGFLKSILPDGAQAPGGFMNPDAVGGPVQMFRRQCFEQIGGLKTYGHADCVAVIQAREKCWGVRSLPQLVGIHHVPFDGYAPTIRYKVPALYNLGQMDYVMYVPFWFVLIQSTVRCFSRPWLVAGVARFSGYLSAVLTRPERTPPQESWWGRQKMYVETITRKLSRMAKIVLQRNSH